MDRASARLAEMQAETRGTLSAALWREKGGTHQERFQQDVLAIQSLSRLSTLEGEETSPFFGRIDVLCGDGGVGADGGVGGNDRERESEVGGGAGTETYRIGRIGIPGRDREPLVIDWRAPAAEPFYRATAAEPMNLTLRRHVESDGNTVTGIEDERFLPPDTGAGSYSRLPVDRGEGAAERPINRGAGDERHTRETAGSTLDPGPPGSLLTAVSRPRSPYMRSVVATIQREQDEIIRAPRSAVLVVEGGPGTGKTAVALHRAAYLLYTYRFPFEIQGILVVGPNLTFLRYIRHVLPSLGETGVALSSVQGLVPGIEATRRDAPEITRLKGDQRMALVIEKAVRRRGVPPETDATVVFDSVSLNLDHRRAGDYAARARGRKLAHNDGRRIFESMVVRHLARQYLSRTAGLNVGHLIRGDRTGGTGGTGGDATDSRVGGDGEVAGVHGQSGDDELDRAAERRALDQLRARLLHDPHVRKLLQRMWPILSAEQLVSGLLGSKEYLTVAGRGILTPEEVRLLAGQHSGVSSRGPWSDADIALIDEARSLLGPLHRRGAALPSRQAPTQGDRDPGGEAIRPQDHEVRRYGHVIIDEAQNLSPMDLRVVARRSMGNSVTLVGDLAQATGSQPPSGWEEIARNLGLRTALTVAHLPVSYRTPVEILDAAYPVLQAASPGASLPSSIRSTGVPPVALRAEPGSVAGRAAAEAGRLWEEVAPGTCAVIAPERICKELGALVGSTPGVLSGSGVTVLPPRLAGGLEFDGVVLADPAGIVGESPEPARTLYVAMTRATATLVIVHAGDLPSYLSHLNQPT